MDAQVKFYNRAGTLEKEVSVPAGVLLSEAARQAQIEMSQPCGGQGRCGRCLVQVIKGSVRPRSTLRLTPEDIAQGYVLGCQAVVEGDVSAYVLAQEKIERRLATDRVVAEVFPPPGYDPRITPSIRRIPLTLVQPTMDNQTDDWSRLQTTLRQQTGIRELSVSLPLLRQIGSLLRKAAWQVTAIIDLVDNGNSARLITLLPGYIGEKEPLWCAAIDIGTTTVTVWLVNLINGQVAAQASDYNGQISRGEDVISRIIYTSKGVANQDEMNRLVINTINQLLEQVCTRAQIQTTEIVKAVVAGNSTMIHLFLNIPAESIRLSPFITAVNHPPLMVNREIGLNIHPEATVDCLPGTASYVGSDISAGVLSSDTDKTEKMSLFLDMGTNGEIVLGSRDWLMTCACSAGPAFEGAGVFFGMRATEGAIEEVWINEENYEPVYRVIGDIKPRGLCGSGLISLLAEMFLAGVLDKAGHINLTLNTARVRQGEHGPEYVVAWRAEAQNGSDIVLTEVDINNLLRAKAAIFAGFSVLATSAGIPLEMVEQVLIGGSFGKYINIEKAIQIGLLPDMPWETFHFLGNTSVKGAYLALLDRQLRARVKEIASHLTYIELSADNSFYEAFMSALFLPHTDLARFPTVAASILKNNKT